MKVHSSTHYYDNGGVGGVFESTKHFSGVNSDAAKAMSISDIITEKT